MRTGGRACTQSRTLLGTQRTFTGQEMINKCLLNTSGQLASSPQLPAGPGPTPSSVSTCAEIQALITTLALTSDPYTLLGSRTAVHP